ncbi:GLIPR1-like protein 1 [Biomphalaria pfeifferi]|uniref:GLIPR1-like protein 1 n=1 Tax=Biomphalaria pfeifferi TaxID=112525 RepID=A0AAD8AS67_BIOPF|nr:GLIPR1-like protein 1 [Biomphalaria pfeifferi]
MLIKRDNTKLRFTAREAIDLVNLHNKLRADEHGLVMLNISWNSDLENNAQNHANKCDFSHSSQAYRSNVGNFSYVGENLYAIGGSSPSTSNIVETWYREKSNYDYGDNSCSGACGHYTQIVWAETTAVGCGIAYCSTITNSKITNGYLVVCQYGPGGNISGKRPYLKASAPGLLSRDVCVTVSLVTFVCLLCLRNSY